jgi:hypothetical protein
LFSLPRNELFCAELLLDYVVVVVVNNPSPLTFNLISSGKDVQRRYLLLFFKIQ